MDETVFGRARYTYGVPWKTEKKDTVKSEIGVIGELVKYNE